jgi:hypothetical protein
MITMSILCWYVYTLTESTNDVEVLPASNGEDRIQVKQDGCSVDIVFL